jgi:hypothetical protein
VNIALHIQADQISVFQFIFPDAKSDSKSSKDTSSPARTEEEDMLTPGTSQSGISKESSPFPHSESHGDFQKHMVGTSETISSYIVCRTSFNVIS